MKRCPECRRDYYDDTLLYCLDDGSALLEGPATVGSGLDEPATAFLHRTDAVGDAPTRAQLHLTDQTAALPLVNASPFQKLRTANGRLAAMMGLIAVLAVGGYLSYRYFGANTKQINSIAVMPFINDSGSSDVEYLSDGMAETLITSLSNIPNLSVKARSTVFFYKGKQISPEIIGRELGVQAVLLGRVAQRGDDLKLTLELVNTGTQNVIWAEQYDRKQSDLVALQDQIARDVSAKLKTKLSGAQGQNASKNSTENPEAFQLYLKGRFYWNKRTERDIKRSIDYFDQAIAADPGYALAYAGLADAYQVLPSYTSDPPPEETYAKARFAARKALEIDSGSAEPHAALGVVLHEFDWNFSEAEREFKRAIEINPNYPSAHQWYSEYLGNMGRFDEAIAEARRAQELDPLSLIINTELGGMYYISGRYDEAITQYKKTLEIDPNFARAYGQMVDAYVQLGMYDEAIDAGRKRRLLEGAPPEMVEQRTATVKDAFRTGGVRGFWQKVVEVEQEAASQNHTEIPPIQLAVYRIRMGDREQARELLEKALASGKREYRFPQMKVDPIWEPLRTDPRFHEMLRKIGFSQ